MTAKNGPGRIRHIFLRYITNFVHNLLRIMTRTISSCNARETPLSPGISSYLLRIIPKGGHRPPALKKCAVSINLRCFCFRLSLAHICHSPPHMLRWQLQHKIIIRLQQNRLRLHQSLTHSAVGCLPKVSSLGMLQMGSSSRHCNFHIS